jgi:hypothetical protein
MTDEQFRDVVHLARQKWQEEWTYTLEDIAAILADHSASQDEQSTGICFFCGEPIDGKHESDCPQASPAASSAATVSDAARVAHDEQAALNELINIANAKRFDREMFADDTEFADWVQSRARHTLRSASSAKKTDIGG